jgi:hypothetical protein
MAKMSVTTLRKIRKELEERAQRVRYNEPHFDKEGVAKSLANKYAKEIAAVGKLRVADLFGIHIAAYHGQLSFQERSDDKFPLKVQQLKKTIQAAYKQAADNFEDASEYMRFKKLSEKIASLEVEVLIGSLATDDPQVIALLEEVRVALQS